MAITFNDNIKVYAPKPSDARYYNNANKPYESIEQVISELPESILYSGLTVNVLGDEYWLKDGVNWELKGNSSGGTMTGQQIVDELSGLSFAEKLQSTDVTYNDKTVKDTLDQLLYVTSGSLIIRASDNGVRKNLRYNILTGSTVIRTGNTTTADVIINLPSGKYKIQVFPIAGYDIFSINISVDNNPADNITSTSTIIDNVDVGFLRSEVNIVLKPTVVPILNNFLINSGATGASTSNLAISLDASGVVSEYIVSQNADFSSGTWLPYNGGDINYTFNYISEILLTLYVKLRNSLGESNSMSHSIFMTNGIRRSDSNNTYNSIEDCINAIMNDYGTGLTQNVIVEVVNNVYLSTKGRAYNSVFYMTIDDFNFEGDYTLTIKGNNMLTIDCKSLGGFKINHCSNFIFEGISFINVATQLYDYAPEQTPAIFAQGTSDRISRNIVINNCIVNGSQAWTDDILHYGEYGFVFKYVDNVTVANTNISGFAAFVFDVLNLKTLTLSNVNIHDCHVAYNIVSQPCFVNIKATDLLYIEDTVFEMSDFETGIITSNVLRFITNRSKYINAKGEAFRLQNTIDMELLEINACVISNCLINPIFQWIKQFIAFNTIKIVKVTNSTIRLTALTGFQMYSFLFRGGEIGKLYSYNNIFDFFFPNMPSNRDEASLFNIGILSYWESDYNLYRDYTADYLTISNMILVTTDSTSPIYFGRTLLITTYRNTGRDVNSTIYNTSDVLFVNDNFESLSTPTISLPVSSGNTTVYDLKKNITNTYNIGAYHQTFSIPTVDNIYQYRGIDTLKLSGFTSDIQYNSFSKNLLLMIPISVDKGNIYEWIVEDETAKQFISYGTCNPLTLYSKLDINGLYAGNMLYSVEMIKIN